MRASQLFAYSIVALVLGLTGCKRDLGECNLDGLTPDGRPLEGPAAFDIAYRLADGLPMYEGQAIVQATCGNAAFCHAPAAVGAARFGVPAGLNFDVALACDEAIDPACAQPESCDGASDTDYCVRFRRLQSNQGTVRDWAEGMIQEIRAGSMPPGAAGERVRDLTTWIRSANGSELPSIDSSEGREIVRNWLACQAPVVARAELPPSEDLELATCPSVQDEICVYTGPQEGLPDPTWSDIYWSVMFTQCVSCHGPSNANDDPNPRNPLGGQIPGGASQDGLDALNLTGSDTTDTSNWPMESWSAVVDALAASPGECAGQGTLVIPDDPGGSIMIQKMRAQQTCGDSMPLGGSISGPLVGVVEAWIDRGAPND